MCRRSGKTAGCSFCEKQSFRSRLRNVKELKTTDEFKFYFKLCGAGNFPAPHRFIWIKHSLNLTGLPE